jgi:hypothetical protein
MTVLNSISQTPAETEARIGYRGAAPDELPDHRQRYNNIRQPKEAAFCLETNKPMPVFRGAARIPKIESRTWLKRHLARSRLAGHLRYCHGPLKSPVSIKANRQSREL